VPALVLTATSSWPVRTACRAAGPSPSTSGTAASTSPSPRERPGSRP